MRKKYISFILLFIVYCNAFAYEFDRTEYYVKEKFSGTGDGSSWENAMDASTFAVALSDKYQIKPGTTFHLAKGTYYPERDPFENNHNYSEDEKKRYKVYYIQSPINIIGGYSENPKEGEKPNPSINITEISGANADNPNTDYKDYLYNLFYFDLKEKDRCYFSGLTLTCTSDNRYMDGGAFCFKSKAGTILELDRCKTKELARSFSYANFGIDDIILSNCIFDNTIIDNISTSYYIYANKAVFNSCSFIESSSSISANDLTIQNCTFAQISVVIYSYEKTTFHNNTVVRKGYNGSQDGFNLRISGDASIIGNIFNCQVDIDLNDENSTGVSKYNLYSKPMDEEDNPLYDKTSDYIADLNEVIESELSYGKSYTPYFKLLRDFLPDGRTVHFPLNMTSVTKDQREVERFDKTCMGSFEKRDTVISLEANYIQIGDKFQGKIYDTIGFYYIPVILPNAAGCDSVTLHKLYVLPNDNDKRTTFYVKTNGKGDGSSWDKAMSPKDFAWRLALSKRIDTFHVAAGTYYPPIMENSGVFERSLPVCIIGGYPENCSDMSQKPDPVQYKTIFSADFNNDNKYDNTLSCISNDQDDANVIFSYVPTKTGKSLISGIVFNGGQCNRNCMNAQCMINRYGNMEIEIGEFKFDQCEFRNTNANTIFYYCGNKSVLNINNCYFIRVKGPMLTGAATNIVNGCTFEGRELYISADSGHSISISNCTMYDCDQINFNLSGDPSAVIRFSNNTISSSNSSQLNICTAADYLYLIGNIIHANVTTSTETTDVYSKYNVYLKQSTVEKIKSETDILVEDFSFLDNKISADENVISPVMIMTSDELPDGNSLRFPQIESSVSKDQRNKDRILMTCVGSYEADCQKDSVYLSVTDTIYIGDFYMGKYIMTEGLTYGVDTLYNLMGCDSLIFHPVMVLPERNIPTAFTPFDTNGKNDFFMRDHEVYIYDIYGKLICHSENGWDGMINDEKANPGIYVYAVKTYSGEMKRGTVELLIQQ